MPPPQEKCKYMSMFGKTNPMWKGNKVGYSSLHEWIKKRFVKPLLCQSCKEKKSLDLANISQKYKRNISDWEWLCRKCHMKKDGRLKKFKKFDTTGYGWKGKKELAKNMFGLYQKGMSFLEISKLYGRHSHSSVRSLIKRYGFIK